MFLRALYLSTSVGMVAAIATAPWQLIISLTLAGLFSGFNPAAVALVSVSVPESRLNRSLSLITGAQYIGTTAGPAVGAILALLVGYRGAIFVSSLVPLATGTLVLFFVPADRVDRRSRQEREADAGGPIESFRMTFQLFLGIFLYFLLFALNQLTRFITPIALAAIEGSDNVEGDAGVAFSLAGLVSAISVLGLAPFFFRVGRLKPALTVSCLFGAAGLALMAASDGTTVYIGGFLVLAAVLSAMTPAINTLIAANAARARRGTAFGIAGSAQALASVIGPSTAAVFAAVSLDLGFGILGGVLVAVSGLLLLTLREPKLE
jgi:DHA1 family multidrug resistance protein-like MFS transporter